jgi:AcrR family transcriptional regulator
MSPRPSNPDARDAALDAARAEFARRGVDRARVEDIARRAGISKGAFYLHFTSKEEAFREILQRFLGVVEEHALRRHEAELKFRREIGNPGAAPCARAFELDCRLDAELLELLWRNRLAVAALDRVVGEPYVAAVADFRRRMGEMVGSQIALKQQEGWLRADVDPDVIADVIIGAYEGYTRRLAQAKAKPDLARWARAFVTLLYQGIVDPSALRGTLPVAPAKNDHRVTNRGEP